MEGAATQAHGFPCRHNHTGNKHMKAAKFMHISIAKMKQSNIPTLKVWGFKYQNYDLALIWGIGSPSRQCNQSQINRQDQERHKNRTESCKTLWLGSWGHQTLTKGAQSTPVCKYQRTTEFQEAQGYVGLFLGLSTSHSGLSSAFNEGDIFPYWLWGKQGPALHETHLEQLPPTCAHCHY